MAVVKFTDRITDTLIRPNVPKLLKSFQVRPIRTAFLSAFILLSCLPILAFLAFSTFVLCSLTFLALGASLIASLLVISFFGFFLALTLSVMFFAALSLTAGAVAAFLALRLFIHIRARGPSGVREWLAETKGRMYDHLKKTELKEEPLVESQAYEDDGDDTKSVQSDAQSAGSTVIVDSTFSPSPPELKLGKEDLIKEETPERGE